MQEVLIAETARGSLPGTVGDRKAWFPPRLGRVERVLERGRYVAGLEGGIRVEVRGPEGLRAGDVVKVRAAPAQGGGKPPAGALVSEGKSGVHLVAHLPFAFGAAGSGAKLEVLAEAASDDFLKKRPRAVYLVISVSTPRLGDIQWCLHLVGRAASLQVYAPGAEGDPKGFSALIASCEEGLRRAGFQLSGPAVRSRRPFRLPASFRFNVRG